MSSHSTFHYHYKQTNNNPKSANTQSPQKMDLPCEQNAGHADHWAILTNDIGRHVPDWLQKMLETASLPVGLAPNRANNTRLLLGENQTCHIKQILSMTDGKPTKFINAFPCVESPYVLDCQIQRIIRCEKTADAILRLQSQDGTIIYAFDQLYSVNSNQYDANKVYTAHFSAWAYQIEPSNQDQTILVEDPKAIRYHRAFNDIVSQNHGQVPDDIHEKIKAWQPEDANTALAPVEINLGHSCIYLFGDTFGQEDEAWCQGQVLGISHTQFFEKDITLFDVVILREYDSKPLVVRIATPTTAQTNHIKVHDYIQANIWLQVAIYQDGKNSSF